MQYKGIIEKFRHYLPVSESTPVVSLLEGNTPLIRAVTLEKMFPGYRIFLKYEGLNPTGSFKDRGMTLAISKAAENKKTAVICASTGNTSASAAAYSARAEINCVVLIPDKAIALGKLAQALIYGAKVIAIKGNFDDALVKVKEISEKYPFELVNSLNQFRIEGQKTAAFEICDTLGEAPDCLFIPVGNAGNITSYWQGFKEYHACRKIDKLPNIYGFQAEGSAPIVKGHVVEDPITRATAIKIGNPARWTQAVEAARQSEGEIDMVSEDEIFSAYKLLAFREGVFVEPASAASVAGLIKMLTAGRIRKGSTIVCVNTGNGLKDPDSAILCGSELKKSENNMDEILSIINS